MPIKKPVNPYVKKNKVLKTSFETRRNYKRLLKVVSEKYPKLTVSQKEQLRKMFLENPDKHPSQILNELAVFISRGK